MKILVALLLSAALASAADITGKWTLNVVLDAGSGVATFNFKQAGEKLTGTYDGTFGHADLTGTVKGNTVEFSFGNDTARGTYSGTLNGTNLKGTCDYGQIGKGTFEGSKN